MTNSSKWYYRQGELASGAWEVRVDAENPPVTGWAHTGVRVATMSQDSQLTIPADNNERIVFILEGESLEVQYKVAGNSDLQSKVLRGRRSVFHGPADFLYLPFNTEIKLSGTSRIAIGECPAKNSKPVQFIAKENVPVNIRGAGRESRQIHNFGMPDVLDADRMITVEAIVPAGNWSGAPAHKHDTYIPGKESHLEEIYYFESAVTRGVAKPSSSSPFGIFRGNSSDSREYDVTEEIHSGDVALVPYGWHGPVAAGPGYDLYFFNVMAGPDPERVWNVTDEPNQVWIRDSWATQLPDPRLPYTELNAKKE